MLVLVWVLPRCPEHSSLISLEHALIFILPFFMILSKGFLPIKKKNQQWKSLKLGFKCAWSGSVSWLFCCFSEFIYELPLIYWRKLRCLYYVIGLSLVGCLFFNRTIISFGKPKPCLTTPLPLSLFAKPKKVFVWTLCFKADQETPRQNN